MEQKWNQVEAGSSAESFVASDQYDDVPIPQMTWGLLRRYIDLAADRVLCRMSAATDGNDSYVRDLLDGMREEFFQLIIGNGEDPSQNSERPTADTDVIEIVDTPLKEEQADSIPDEENTTDDCVQEYHSPKLRKDVPRTAVYRARGVRCKLCWMAFKGDSCVKALILHTKQRHSDAATPTFLEKIRKDNSYKNILGDGIWYCTCENCLFIGLARWDKRFDKARNRNFRGRK